MLELEGVDVFYGDLQALRGVSLRVESGEIVTLVGGNGAGKTTMLRTVSGLLRPRRGEIRFEGRRLDRLPPGRIVEAGGGPGARGGEVFSSLTVGEKLGVRA